MKNVLIMVVGLLLFGHVIPTKAQVTIGSNAPAVSGALLQIKENENSGVNATRGLGMPRISLTRLSALNDVGSNLNKSEHVGLIIYNTSNKGDSICPGLYVWDSLRWIPLLDEGVETLTDTRTRADGTTETAIYPIRSFDTAGVWMLQNLRATTYADNLRIAKPSNDMTLFYNNNSQGKSFYYPMASKALFDTYPEWGMMYTWAAASIGSTSTQGICTQGWHLPSNTEWNQLEQAIADNQTGLYTIDGYKSLPWNITWATLGGFRGTHGKSMKNSSETPIDGFLSNGKSRTKCNGGGFNVYLIGYLNNGNRVYKGTSFFWSTSPSTSNASLMQTRMFEYNKDGVSMQSNNKADQMPVRCKKDDENYCPNMIDQDGNVYPTKLFGTQCWATQNLRTTKAWNGDALNPHMNPGYYSNSAGPYPATATWMNSSTMISSPISMTQKEFATKYGAMYKWNEAKQACPTGWHLPSDAEWTILGTTLGGDAVAGAKMKADDTIYDSLDGESYFWGGNALGSANNSGFNAYPTGLLDTNTSTVGGFSSSSYMWSSTPAPNNYVATYRYLDSEQAELYTYMGDINYSYTVRCLKD